MPVREYGRRCPAILSRQSKSHTETVPEYFEITIRRGGEPYPDVTADFEDVRIAFEITSPRERLGEYKSERRQSLIPSSFLTETRSCDAVNTTNRDTLTRELLLYKLKKKKSYLIIAGGVLGGEGLLLYPHFLRPDEQITWYNHSYNKKRRS